jgi:hypothetical protein
MNDSKIEWVKSHYVSANKRDMIGAVDGLEAFKVAWYPCWSIYRAYFKPKNWCNFGNSVEHNSNGRAKGYKTLEEAQAACIEHLKAFGINPAAEKRLRG